MNPDRRGAIGQDERHDVISLLREATRQDVPAMHRIRMAVTENRLTSALIWEADYVRAIEVTGRGWVVEAQGEIVAFSIGNATNGNMWALFVHPDHERRGYGRRLHDATVEWLCSAGPDRLWLTTSAGTRAERFYTAADWKLAGVSEDGQLIFERSR